MGDPAQLLGEAHGVVRMLEHMEGDHVRERGVGEREPVPFGDDERLRDVD